MQPIFVTFPLVMSRLSSNEHMDFTQPSPPPQSPPSGVLSPTPNPLSWISAMDGLATPTPSSRPTTEIIAAFGAGNSKWNKPHTRIITDHRSPTGSITSKNLYLPDGQSNPNISGTMRPHPSQLDQKYCNPNCDAFYVVTTGWEVGIFDNW